MPYTWAGHAVSRGTIIVWCWVSSRLYIRGCGKPIFYWGEHPIVFRVRYTNKTSARVLTHVIFYATKNTIDRNGFGKTSKKIFEAEKKKSIN